MSGWLLSLNLSKSKDENNLGIVMSLESAYLFLHSYLVANQLVALAILIGLAIFLWKKPAAFFKFTLAIVCLIVALYIGSLLGGSGQSGVKSKNMMINETERKIFN